MAGAEEERGDDGYSKLEDVRIGLYPGVVGDGFCLCFWLYLSSPAQSSSVIIHQLMPGVRDAAPFLALSEENKLILFPLLMLHKEAPTPGSSYPWTDTSYLRSVTECSMEKWVHVGCEVTRNLIRLHIDGNLVGETRLPSFSNKQGSSDDSSLLRLVGNDGKLEGYIYDVQVSPMSETTKHHYVKNPPLKLFIDDLSTSDEIEECGDGVWSIVGGKASCRRSFSLEVLLLDAFGKPVKNEMEVLSSLVYADNRAVVEQSEDNAEAPLLISIDGLEYPSTSKPVPLLHGRAIFKLQISQLSSKSNNRLFRVYFHTPHTQRYPFLEAFSNPILCTSQNRNSHPSCLKKATSATFGEIHTLNYGQGTVCDSQTNVNLQHSANSLECFHPSKCSRLEGSGAAMEIDDNGLSKQDEMSKMAVCVETQNAEGTDSETSGSESNDAKSSENEWQRNEIDPFSDAVIFRYCLEGTYERSIFLKWVVGFVSVEDLENFADQVSLYSGCSHHRNQILLSKQLVQEGDDTWSAISRNKDRALWADAIPEIVRKFILVSNSATRGLSGQDLEVLREIAGCIDDLGREEFDRLWCWLYPVACSLSREKMNKLWKCISPQWIEGLITRDETENALRGSEELQNPGTFVLRFPTSRTWPHPDAGSLVVSFVGSDSTIHHKLLALDYSDNKDADLQDLLLKEPELSQLGRVRPEAALQS